MDRDVTPIGDVEDASLPEDAIALDATDAVRDVSTDPAADASFDAPSDASGDGDASSDAPHDTSEDTPLDTSVDGNAQVDGSADAPSDAGDPVDGTADVPSDGGTPAVDAPHDAPDTGPSDASLVDRPDVPADPCAGVSCNAPPPASCADADTLRSFDPVGACAAGACSYAARSTTCRFGCAAGACRADPCAGVTCEMPPADSCVDADTLRRFARPGVCSGGSCTYAPRNETCAFGCAAGACRGDLCAGVTCNAPPASVCRDATTLRRFVAPGTCAGGGCTYRAVEETCAIGCSAGACASDPCAGVTCASPPAPTCADGATLRTFVSPGRCAAGSCVYDASTRPCGGGCAAGACVAPTCGGATCDQPPRATCLTATRARTYARLGTCAAGACAYQAIELDCSMGCLNGACLAGSDVTEHIPLPTIDARDVAVEVDASGAPHVAVCDVLGDHYYRYRDDYGWHQIEVDRRLGSGCDLAFARDRAGLAHFVYYDPTNQDARYATVNPADGSVNVSVIERDGNVGRGPVLALSASGLPTAAYAHPTAGWRVATRTAAGWSMDALPGTFSGTTVQQLAYRDDGALVVATGNDATSAPVAIGVRGPGGWTRTEVTATGRVGRDPMRVTRDGVDLAWFENAPRGVATHVRWNSPAGVTERILPTGEAPTLLSASTSPRRAYTYHRTTTSETLRSWTYSPSQGWATATFPSSSLTPVFDLAEGPDRSTYIANGAAVFTRPFCRPACDARVCGDDGCGGSCGACAAGTSCMPDGTCGMWRVQRLALAAVGDSVSSLACFIDRSERVTVAATTARSELFYGRVGAESSAALRPTGVSDRLIGLTEDESGALILATNFSASRLAQALTEAPTGWRSSIIGYNYFVPGAYAYLGAGTHAAAFGTSGLVRYDSRDAMFTPTTLEDLSAAPTYTQGTVSEERLAVAATGVQHALWKFTPRLLTTAQVRYGSTRTGAFVAEQLYTGTAPLPDNFQLVVDRRGSPHVFFRTGTVVTTSTFVHMTRDTGAWRSYPFTSTGNFPIFFAGTDGTLFALVTVNLVTATHTVYRFTGSLWTVFERLPVLGGVPLCAAADGAGRVRFAIRDPETLHNVLVFRRD